MKTTSNPTYRALNTYTKLMRAAESVTGRVHRVLAAPRLTISQFGVLEALYHKGPLCQRDIAAKILKSTGNITLVIDNLEKQGLVKRERTSEDRRYLTVKLTELKVPAALHEDIKNAVLTGKIPKLLPDLYTPVIENPTMDVVNQLFPAGVADLADERVIAEGIVNATNAALDAVGNGVSWSLWVAGAIIIISGVVAYFTFPRTS